MTQRLAERADLYRLGIPSVSIAAVSTADQDSQLDAASEWLLGMIGSRYKRPLVSWEDDVRAAVCKYAAYDILCIRGYNPAAAADVNVRNRRDDAERWATAVARQEISPSITGQADQSPGYDAPRIVGRGSQGWKDFGVT